MDDTFCLFFPLYLALSFISFSAANVSRVNMSLGQSGKPINCDLCFRAPWGGMCLALGLSQKDIQKVALSIILVKYLRVEETKRATCSPTNNKIIPKWNLGSFGFLYFALKVFFSERQ